MADDLGDIWWLGDNQENNESLKKSNKVANKRITNLHIGDENEASAANNSVSTKVKKTKKELSVKSDSSVQTKNRKHNGEANDNVEVFSIIAGKKTKKRKLEEEADASEETSNVIEKKKKRKLKKEDVKNDESQTEVGKLVTDEESHKLGKRKTKKKAVSEHEVETTTNRTVAKTKVQKLGKSKNEPTCGDDEQSAGDVAVEQPPKKKKKNKRKSISKSLAEKKDIPLIPWDLISAISAHYKSTLSGVELDELQLQDEHFTVCSDLTYTSTSYIKAIMPHWKKLTKGLSGQNGCPLILVLCASGQRAADFISKKLKKGQKNKPKKTEIVSKHQLSSTVPDLKVEGFRISKLFAKHLKLEEQVAFLGKHPTHIGVGSPNRIQLLIENGALKLDQCKCIVVDWSFRDAKLRRLIDIKEVQSDFMTLLRKHIIPRVRTGSTKIGLF